MSKAEIQNYPTLPPRDDSLRHNYGAQIPDVQNCRLWITGLPATCTVHKLLKSIGSIGPTGPVYACHIVTPRLSSSTLRPWETAAASLTFFTADAANRLLNRAAERPFVIEHHVAEVARHRIRTETTYVNGRSRVLRIVGDPTIVRPEYLARVFSECWFVRFDTDFVRFQAGRDRGAWNDVTWAFGSFKGQAQVVHSRINRQFVGQARAMYLADPCGF
ncbi:hypothetical protein F4859DRAFT_489638 [Xylaria cf. heliscus]|nr:hypothetical protein F4859DRAFT_489638 [Xylaria cf. heliscus]